RLPPDFRSLWAQIHDCRGTLRRDGWLGVARVRGAHAGWRRPDRELRKLQLRGQYGKSHLPTRSDRGFGWRRKATRSPYARPEDNRRSSSLSGRLAEEQDQNTCADDDRRRSENRQAQAACAWGFVARGSPAQGGIITHGA